MNVKQRIAAGMAAVLLAGSILGNSIQIQAQVVQTQDNCSKAMQTEFIQSEDLLLRAGRFALNHIQVDDSYNLAESVWADSGSDYYFSLLQTEEKKLYLNLKKQADRYLNGTEQFQVTEVSRGGQSASVCILPLVSYEGLATQQMKKVFYCFLFENPQYYFMRNSVIYSENTKMMTVGLYDRFADGAERAEYTRQLAVQLQLWEEQISAAQTEWEKEQLIHKIVCDHVAYDEAMDENDPDDKQMSQSCISAVLFDRKTVCAGYAQMFALLCGRAGITCVTVTSPGHAWNKVRLGNVWYNVDCTWNDSRGDDTFLNVTDAQLLAADTQLLEHTLSEEWTELAPACTTAFDREAGAQLDADLEQEANMQSGADEAQDAGTSADLTSDGAGADVQQDGASGNVQAPANLVENVVLSSEEKGRLTVSFAPLEGCDGYTVQYASNNAMLPADKVDVESASFMIEGLKSGKAYYVRVRAYRWNSNGEKLYGTFSKKVKGTVM